MQTHPIYYKDLVLIGGGHSHALLLKMWPMKPLPGVRLTLISPQVQTPYSGMLPGLIAGHYSFDEAHIDLVRLCRYAGVRFIQEQVTRIDLQQKEVHFSHRPPLEFDVLSINSGITPDLSVPGSLEHTVPVKPIAQFYPRWQGLLTHLCSRDDTQNQPYRIAVVGGGAAGAELILAMQHSLKKHPGIKTDLQFHLVQKGQGIPENYPPRLQQKMKSLFRAQDITVHDRCTVTEVSPGQISSVSAEKISADTVFWCAQAKAADWPKQSGLAVDSDGFIDINENLQSTSHKFVFAAGDIAKQANSPTPRAGVYAVRQAPYLLKNIRRYFLQQPLTRYSPQAHFLSLLACGDQYAFGCKPKSLFPTLSGKWVWRWKDHIDRKFMLQFSNLPAKGMTGRQPKEVPFQLNRVDSNNAGNSMRCGGCGAKVGASILSRTLKKLHPVTREGVMLGLNSADDAAAISIPSEQWLIQSVDVFKSLVDDPYQQGQIAALHALSDLFAMNAVPHSAQAIVTLPYASEALVERDLLQLMSGALQILNENQCALIGGHTSEGAELSIGFSVNGLASAKSILRKNQPQPGDKLILTQALGTGVLFAAHNQWQADGRWIETALETMLLSNRKAGDIFNQYNANACTDITGFGLAGHLIEMLTPDNKSSITRTHLASKISLIDIPLLKGAKVCSQKGFHSSLYSQNLHAQSRISHSVQWQDHTIWPLLFDPQTSGGLLASIPASQAEDCLAAILASGYKQACIIGEVVSSTDPNNMIELHT